MSSGSPVAQTFDLVSRRSGVGHNLVEIARLPDTFLIYWQDRDWVRSKADQNISYVDKVGPTRRVSLRE